ncbi:pyrroline-5-carboxylate reductase [Treponema sp.]|uniref:pyrroline-5-carboxylate reductase n=1 Tax=Treponema sp. TaxID=166 RepID=UPI003F0FF6CC
MKLGFIGMGNMAKALAAGFISSGRVEKNSVFAFAPNQEKLRNNSAEIGFVPCGGLFELVQSCDVLIMACKPYQIEDVLSEIKEALCGKVLVSVAAGWNFQKFQDILRDGVRIQCVMPNTPAMVGEGVMLFEAVNSLLPGELQKIKDLFSSVGIVEELPTRLMGIGGAISGCGPAFMDLIIEAYADAAVKYGIPRQTAYRLVSKTMLGAAKLQLETGSHPGALKDAVCSPGGTTICGVDSLEKSGLRGACISSIDAIMLKKI